MQTQKYSQLFYRRASKKKDAPVVILIHGVAGSSLLWQKVIDRLAPNFDVIAIDLMGYGRSPRLKKIAYTSSLHSESIHETIRAIGLSKPYLMVGLSMGANLAIEYAARYRDEINGVVCVGLPYYRDEAEARAELQLSYWTREALNHPRRARLVIPIIWFIGRHFTLLSDHLSGPIYTGAIAKDAMSVLYHAYQSSLINCMVHQHTKEALHKIGNKPVLFARGDKDRWSPLVRTETLAATYPNSQLRIIENSPHNTVMLAPDETAKCIEEFWQAL